jgi:hypothetical protein
MAPTPGMPVQYIGESCAVYGAVVTMVHDKDCVNLNIYPDGLSAQEDFGSTHPMTVRRTSVVRGIGPCNWRPLPREGPEG